ncbi:MAG TPA: acyltransferase [Bacteroidia bacterium]|jgi:peptidoglycan/LPS O-acetylase OafA/YrhL|nr:acyltransferase [Bacteroidia bacterium]
MCAKKIVPTAGLSIGYFPGLDVLRFICATGVIFHHTAKQLFERGLIASSVASQILAGPFFLNVFFIISGFLISAILMKENESGKYNLKNFYLRRIIRIWPLYFFIVLVLIVLVPLLKHSPSEIIKTNAFYALGFSVNFQLMINETAKTYSVLWSVCIEEHIYLLLPFLLFVFRKNFKILSLFLIFLGLASWFYFSYLHSSGRGFAPYFNCLCYFYYFGLGMFLALFHSQIASIKLKSLFSIPGQLVICSLLVLYVFSFLPGGVYAFPVWLLLCGFFGAYVVAAASRTNFIFKLPLVPSRFTGNISYAMYLVHTVIINVLINYLLKKNIHPEGAAVVLWIPLIATLFSIVIATLLYYLYERPFLKLKKKFSSVANK